MSLLVGTVMAEASSLSFSAVRQSVSMWHKDTLSVVILRQRSPWLLTPACVYTRKLHLGACCPFPCPFQCTRRVYVPIPLAVPLCLSCSWTVPICLHVSSALRSRIGWEPGGGSLAEVLPSFPRLTYSHRTVSDLHSHTGTQKHDEARVESSIGILSSEKSGRREGRQEGSQGSTCCSSTGF